LGDKTLKIIDGTEKVLGCFYKVSNTLWGGFVEKV